MAQLKFLIALGSADPVWVNEDDGMSGIMFLGCRTRRTLASRRGKKKDWMEKWFSESLFAILRIQKRLIKYSGFKLPEGYWEVRKQDNAEDSLMMMLSTLKTAFAERFGNEVLGRFLTELENRMKSLHPSFWSSPTFPRRAYEHSHILETVPPDTDR